MYSSKVNLKISNDLFYSLEKYGDKKRSVPGMTQSLRAQIRHARFPCAFPKYFNNNFDKCKTKLEIQLRLLESGGHSLTLLKLPSYPISSTFPS